MKITGGPKIFPERALSFDKLDASASYSPEAFRDSYAESVGAELLSQDPSFSLASLKGQSLTTVYKLALQSLGAAQAVGLGGEAMTALASLADVSDADTGMLRNVQAERVGETSGGAPMYLGPDELTGYGLSTTKSIVLPQGFESLIGHPSGDFIIGHELRHVENGDVVKKFGRKVLVEGLEDSMLQTEAQQDLVALEREMELAADTGGILYAREQGHSKAQVKAAVSQFLAVTEAGGSDSHPARELRLANITQALDS